MSPHWLSTVTLAVALAALLPLAASAAPMDYRLDPAHSQVWFRVDHQGFSHPLGRLPIARGWFRFDPDDWSASRVEVEFALTEVDLDEPNASRELRSSRLLDVARWPSARYQSQSVERRDETRGVVHGVLSLHGISRPVDLEFRLNRIAFDPYSLRRKAGFSARARLSRAQFGMRHYVGVIGDEVEILIEVEGLRVRRSSTEEP